MKKEICIAVENLPEELITPEIAAAAIKEGNVKLLDYLPHKYLTGEVIIRIITKKESSYRWDSFSLGSIPKNLRTQTVCDYAVGKSLDNFPFVPQECRNLNMLEKMVDSADRTLKYLHLFHESKWNTDIVYKGINDIYIVSTSNYGRRGAYHGCSTSTNIKNVQVFLSFVPRSLKTKAFYMGLFSTQLSPNDINVITPDRYKKRAYYIQIAKKEFSLVPAQVYEYDIFMEAISHGQISFRPSYYNQPKLSKELQETIFSVMDDAMADKIIEVEPDVFKVLPEKFQTSKRLITAIKKEERGNLMIDESYHHLFTKEVCKTYILKNKDMPKLPQSIWNQDFVDYCMKHGTSFNWFEQMPKHFQTREMVSKVLDYSSHHLSQVRPELISLEQAQELYRDNEYHRKNIPQHFIREFMEETGLDEKFFGGDLPFSRWREDRKNYTYCRLGHSYIGFYTTSCYRDADHYLIMTRRTPQSIKPEVVSNTKIGTYHTTWFEKMIADYDRQYTKPTVAKKLKELQINPYYALESVETAKGMTIYRNTLLDETINFTALVNGSVASSSTLDGLKDKIQQRQQQTLTQHAEMQLAAV